VVLGLLICGNAFAEYLMLNCSFKKIYYEDWDAKKYGETYFQSDLSDKYDDIYVEIKFNNTTLNSFGTNYGFNEKNIELEDYFIDDAYFRFNYLGKNSLEKINIDRYSGNFKSTYTLKNKSGY
tara:strand:- start:194 stop:562 length:369 start_codon:yes stop_codon:yes gene_type:complete